MITIMTARFTIVPDTAIDTHNTLCRVISQAIVCTLEALAAALVFEAILFSCSGTRLKMKLLADIFPYLKERIKDKIIYFDRFLSYLFVHVVVISKRSIRTSFE
jgi:hypothetical protein